MLTQSTDRFSPSVALYPDTTISISVKTRDFNPNNNYYQYKFKAAEPQLKFNLGQNLYTKQELSYIIDFFYKTRGRCRSFSFKDSSDYQFNQVLYPSEPTKYYFSKTYSWYVRRIYRPIANTVKVFVSDIEVTTGYTIDQNNGALNFNNPPNGELRVEGDFDCLVRFGSDSLDVTFEGYDRHTNEALYRVTNLELVEVFPLFNFPEWNLEPELYQPVEIPLPTTGENGSSEVAIEPVTELLLLDIPIRRDSAPDYALYIAASGTENWDSAFLVADLDGSTEEDYFDTDTILYETTYGKALTGLNAIDCHFLDRVNTVNIQLYKPQMQIESISEDVWLTGDRNLILLGNEILCFRDATLIEEGKYRLSNFVRGLRGTELEINNHSINERFVLLDNANELSGDSSFINRLLRFKAPVSEEQSFDEIDTFEITYTGKSARPFHPVNLRATKLESGTIKIEFDPRSRRGFPLEDYIDLTAEPNEFFIVNILDPNNNIVRSFTLNTPNALYTPEQQIENFGGTLNFIRFEVIHLGLQSSINVRETVNF